MTNQNHIPYTPCVVFILYTFLYNQLNYRTPFVKLYCKIIARGEYNKIIKLIRRVSETIEERYETKNYAPLLYNTNSFYDANKNGNYGKRAHDMCVCLTERERTKCAYKHTYAHLPTIGV